MRTQEVVTKLTQLLEEMVIDLCSPETEKMRFVASAPPPCCILHDMFSTWAQDVVNNLQLAKHMLYVSPACCLAILFQVTLPIPICHCWDKLTDEDVGDWSKVRTLLPGSSCVLSWEAIVREYLVNISLLTTHNTTHEVWSLDLWNEGKHPYRQATPLVVIIYYITFYLSNTSF
jgi:hypothetical protein